MRSIFRAFLLSRNIFHEIILLIKNNTQRMKTAWLIFRRVPKSNSYFLAPFGGFVGFIKEKILLILSIIAEFAKTEASLASLESAVVTYLECRTKEEAASKTDSLATSYIDLFENCFL